ncbi:MAG: hypothetical protein CRU78_11045 [Candidatus Accumulibacter phosphatis]|uniref:Sulfatase-modifying factor enzyme-like domain-containing protein n=1 Tax=Candidatus Accumulibacter phosphatis TaxID=327160 RepID=A0A6A7RUL4_9PROT|nr:hypothetical protein [Candidatus Accumulibacter phosphatis]
MKLYVTYTPSDLAEHAQKVCSKGRDLGWDLVNSVEIVDPLIRQTELDRSDAFLLLSASFYGGGEGVVSAQEAEWEAAQEKSMARGALLVNPMGNWPLHKVQKGDAKVAALERFHAKVKKSPFRYFDSDVNSICDVLEELLGEIRVAANERKQVNLFVVWDFSVQGLDFILAAFQKRPPEGFKVKVLGIPGAGGAGEIFRDIVLTGIKESHRVLIVTDRPNANVGFEAGLALGFGKPISLVFFCSSVPDWLKTSAFKGFVVNPVQDLDQLREVVRKDDNWYMPPAPKNIPVYGKTLFLSPSCYVGSALREALMEEQKTRHSSWRVIGNNRFNLNDLQSEFPDVTQVIWCISSFAQGADNRDGAENAANAVICGWFYARTLSTAPDTIDKRVLVMRQEGAREVIDVGVKESVFKNSDEFLGSVKVISDNDYALPEPVTLPEDVFSASEYSMVCVPRLQGDSEREKRLWVGRYPVTNRQYEIFCQRKNYPEPEYWSNKTHRPNQPVVNVSLEDVDKFCAWADLELPDRALWDYFSRAGSGRKYWWGDDHDLVSEVAWTENNSGKQLHDVGEKRASTWGLYDIFGNVWEWTARYTQLVTTGISGDQKEVPRAKIFGGAYDSPLDKVTLPVECPVTEKKGSIGFRCVKFTD